MSKDDSKRIGALLKEKDKMGKKSEKASISKKLDEFHQSHVNHTLLLTQQLEALTGLESRLTILGHLQRGGTPSAADRILATHLGTACVELIEKEEYGAMLAVHNNKIVPVPLEEIAGAKKLVSSGHPWLESARRVGTVFGD
jgi:6-phosphofructokinase 1